MYDQGLRELGKYLDILNEIQEMPAFWTAGDLFVPPPVIVTDLGDVAFVYPSINGVVTYDLADERTIAGAVVSISIYLIMAAIAREAAAQLVGQVAVASLTRGF